MSQHSKEIQMNVQKSVVIYRKQARKLPLSSAPVSFSRFPVFSFSLFLHLLSISVLFTAPAHSIEVATEVATPVEAVLSETLTSGVLSYYEGKPFRTLSLTAFRSAFGATPAYAFGINVLYMGMIAESTYLFGSLLGHKGSLGWALGGAYLPPLAFYIVTDILTMERKYSSSKALSAARLGIAFAPITSAAAYHCSTSLEGFGKNRENADFVAAQILGSYYGMAIANIGLESLSIGLRNTPSGRGGLRFLSATSLGISGGLSAYGIGELRGSGNGSLHSTLLLGVAASAIGATVGALMNKGETGGSHWLDGYHWSTVIFSDTVAPIGYGLFQPGKEYNKVAQTIGGYYGSAIVGSSMDLLSRRRYISDKKFALIRATAMSLASGFATYRMGKHQDANNGGLGQTMLGSLSAPTSGFLLTSYIGIPEGYDEMYRVASFLSPLTALVGYHFPSDDFRASEDNNSVFTAEVFGGYLGAGIVALSLNHTGYDVANAWSDWRRSVVRCTVLSLASASTVYALGEKYGSGQGTFVDSLKGSFAAPVGVGALPLAHGLLIWGVGDVSDFLTISQAWNEASLIGVLFSPILAAHFYNSGVDSASSNKKADSSSPKAAPPQWKMCFPLLQMQF